MIVNGLAEDRLRIVTLPVRKITVAPPGKSSNTSSVAVGRTFPSQLAAWSQKPVPVALVNTAVAWAIVKFLVVVPAPIGLPTRSLIAD